ncbi:hypothetical protein E3N88_27557 [Mikania micrantha]|uniref:RING-type E3 ubiquitin transferase n=1 Tax=Mikania micrantha TaxID=192012 RepID=A0A5N6MY07_9ASTR|nr:hypothetical protein E3N88_27557 [Mikania micrantha]
MIPQASKSTCTHESSSSSSSSSFFFFTVFTLKAFSFTTQKIPYSVHCNSYAPSEAIPTHRILTRYRFLEPIATHYTGGRNILDSSQRSIFFEAARNIFATNVVDTYKVHARLTFASSNIYYHPSNFTSIRSNYPRVGGIYRLPLVFNLDGFWSVSTNKLCMVGSARWFTKDDYFDPISILGFPSVATFKYNYTLVCNEDCNHVAKAKTLQDSVTSMRSLDICSLFLQRFTTYKLQYPSNCNNCSLFGQAHNGYLPSFVSLYAIQCSHEEKKLRLLVEFQDRRFTPYDQSFQPDISLIGEGTWNGTKDELCILACSILNQSDPLGAAGVGDCSTRLTLWFPAVRSITKTHTTEGLIWTTNLTDELRFSRMAEFQSFDHSQENYGSNSKYDYTQMEKVRRIFPKKKRAGAKYSFGFYGFDMFVKHKNMVSSGSVVPIFVGGMRFNDYRIGNSNFSSWQEVMPSMAETTTYIGPVNINFEISFMLNTSSISRSGISSLNLSTTQNDKVEISAEGIYDDETGQICMVGCRNLIKNASFDCEILVTFQLPQGHGSLIKGNIKSLRKKSDVLYFEKLDIVSLTITEAEAIDTIWIMDLKIIMHLISNTLMCVFTGRQLFHLKKRPEITSFISALTMLILTLGHMIPLVLNFEVILSDTRIQQNVPIGRNGLLEVNEVIVRIVVMAAFILQFRLLQLTWNAKKNRWIYELRTLFICLPMYFISGLAMLLLNWNNNNGAISSQNQHSIWGNVRSYTQLTLDVIVFFQQRFGGRFMFPKRFQEHVEYETVPATSNG